MMVIFFYDFHNRGNYKKSCENSKNFIKGDKSFDIIMLDIAMPDMDGTEVLFNIREIEKNHNNAEENQTKIIMVTSHSDKGHLVACVQAGCDDYVIKPFDLKSISSKIEKIKSKKTQLG